MRFLFLIPVLVFAIQKCDIDMVHSYSCTNNGKLSLKTIDHGLDWDKIRNSVLNDTKFVSPDIKKDILDVLEILDTCSWSLFLRNKDRIYITYHETNLLYVKLTNNKCHHSVIIPIHDKYDTKYKDNTRYLIYIPIVLIVVIVLCIIKY